MIKIIIITDCLVIKIENLFFHVNKTYLSWDNKILNSQYQATIKSLQPQTWKRETLSLSIRFRRLLFCDHIFNVRQLLIVRSSSVFREQKTFTFNKQLTISDSFYLFNLQKLKLFVIFQIYVKSLMTEIPLTNTPQTNSTQTKTTLTPSVQIRSTDLGLKANRFTAATQQLFSSSIKLLIISFIERLVV